jgi:26S proteasome regulatory subunit N2
LELKVKKAAPAPTPGAARSSGDEAPEGVSVTSGAAPVDDNLVDEGDDEASVPRNFDYESDTNPNDDD